MNTPTALSPAPRDLAATADSGTIRLGAAMRRAAAASVAGAGTVAASVADTGRIRLGAAMRIYGPRHA